MVKQRHHTPQFPAGPFRTIGTCGWQSEVIFPLPLCPPSTCHAARHRRIFSFLRDPVHPSQRCRQLSRLRVHRFRPVLRSALPHGDASGVHRAPGLAPCPRHVRRLSRWGWRGLVCPLQVVRRTAGRQDGAEHLSPPHRDAGSQSASPAGNLRAVSLAQEVLGSAIKGYQSLFQRRAEHSAAAADADQDRRWRCECRPGKWNSLAHEHRQHHHLLIRSQAAEHTLRADSECEGRGDRVFRPRCQARRNRQNEQPSHGLRRLP